MESPGAFGGPTGLRNVVEPEPSKPIRRITDHKNNKYNREHIEVHAMDVPSSDGANHNYCIEAYIPAQTPNDQLEVVSRCYINFQNGGLREVGPNGITDQALLAVVLDRVRGFNEGPYRCRENSLIITKLEEAMMWMEKRSNDRARRGVEGVRTA